MSKTAMVTYTGKSFDICKFGPADICIEDIAHHLALINRFQGAVKVPYSVAEHCVRASYLTIGDPLVNLLHDAAEAYLGDVIRPQKDISRFLMNGIVKYKEVEEELLFCIYRKYGAKTDFETMTYCKAADDVMLVTEIRDLMPEHPLYDRITALYKPLPNNIEPWDWKKAETEYLRRFKELTQ